MRRQRVLKTVLLCTLGFFCVVSLLSLLNGCRFISDIFDSDATQPGRLFLLINATISVVAACAWAIVARFVYLVRKHNEVFSKRQSRKFLALGDLFFARFLLRLLLPIIRVHGVAHAVGQALSSRPTIDVFALSLAVVFFTLGAVFEYGRILQEDADNIL